MVKLRTILAAIIAVAACGGSGQAQGPQQPVQPIRPTVSPYLNLFRQGTPPAINYYNLVRPQTQFYNSIQQLQQQSSTNAQGLTSLEQSMGQRTSMLPPTGFVPSFMSYRQYFLTYNGASTLGTGVSNNVPAAPPQPPTARDTLPRANLPSRYR